MSEYKLRLVSPEFDSYLTDVLMDLNHLRRLQLKGIRFKWIFFELKQIFQMMESIGSARIEGNRTTISEYVEKKIENETKSSERFTEISNVEDAMEFISTVVEEGDKITHGLIYKIHEIVVNRLNNEGDRTPGKYRTYGVKINGASHTPPNFNKVQEYMDELLEFINEEGAPKYQLLKIAIAHHRFTWIHPFGNGNGRVVRLLTYALLIKYGFNVKEGKIINPTAVFCCDREAYYDHLAQADRGDDESMLGWCEYVLSGIYREVEKIDKLLDHRFLYSSIIVPTISLAKNRGYINEVEYEVLSFGAKENNQEFKSSDLIETLGMTSAQRSVLLSDMKERNIIKPITKNGRIYRVSFANNFLMRSLIQVLERNEFIPPID